MHKIYHTKSNFFLENQTYYTNTLDHSWEDLRNRHCNMIEEMAVQNDQPAHELKHETKFEVCDTLRCYICLKRFLEIGPQQIQKKVADKLISGSTVEKPYVLTRSKVDFTMEDLENDTEDIDFSPDLSVPDIYERQQPKRICKKDLFLNQ